MTVTRRMKPPIVPSLQQMSDYDVDPSLTLSSDKNASSQKKVKSIWLLAQHHINHTIHDSMEGKNYKI